MGIVGPKSTLDSREIGDLRGGGVFDLIFWTLCIWIRRGLGAPQLILSALGL